MRNQFLIFTGEIALIIFWTRFFPGSSLRKSSRGSARIHSARIAPPGAPIHPSAVACGRLWRPVVAYGVYSSRQYRYSMKIEHFALQVSDPVAMADWYQKHLGCAIKRSSGAPTHQKVYSDSSGSIMLEFYHNPRVPVPDYQSMDPLLVHIAFIS